MKLTYAITTAAIASMLGVHDTQASTIVPFSSTVFATGEGAPYRWSVTLGETDTGEVIRRVGAWAWEDKSLLGASGTDPVGWTHNSEWFALTLESDVLLTIRVQNRGDVVDPSPTGTGFYGTELFPGFTLLDGWDTDGDTLHFYQNRLDIAWTEDLDFIMNPEPNGTHVMEVTVPVAAGFYTLVVGGNSTSETNEGFQGYQANFTTAPVPEPGSVGLALTGGLALLARRRRHFARI